VNNGLRVLHATNMYPTRADPAFGAFVAAQVQSLGEAGVHVQLEFIDGRRNDVAYVAGLGRIIRLSRSGAFDVVHAHYGLTGFVAAFQRLPLVVTYYGDDLLGTPDRHGRVTWKSRVIRGLGALAARRADALICMSEGMRAALPRASDRARAHVIPNGVDLARFAPGERSLARARLGLDPAERLVLFPNTPGEPRKRLDLAEAGLARLAVAGVAARLWVVTRVAHDQMPDYYRAADCLLLTSDWEGSPNVVKEALCCDLPVVSVDCGDVAHWLPLAPGCELVERDPAAIAAALGRLFERGARVDGARARRELDVHRIAERVVAVYHEAIARRQGRGR
jgi:glycosyltransferase involved in cell wall biosynthesis